MENQKSDKPQIILAFIILFILIIALISLIYVVKKYSTNTTNSIINNYQVTDYVTVSSLDYDYESSFGTFNVNTLSFNNLNNNLINEYLSKQEQILESLNDLKSKIVESENTNIIDNSIKSNISSNIIKGILTIKYELIEDIKTINYTNTYVITLNIDLTTMTLLKTSNLMTKYNYDLNNLSTTLFNNIIELNTDTTKKVVSNITNAEITIDDIINTKDNYISNINTNIDTISNAFIINESLYITYRNSDIEKQLYQSDQYNEEYNEMQIYQ